MGAGNRTGKPAGFLKHLHRMRECNKNTFKITKLMVLEQLIVKAHERTDLPNNFGGQLQQPAVYRGEFRHLGIGNRIYKIAVNCQFSSGFHNMA